MTEQKFTIPTFEELTRRSLRNVRDRFGRAGVTRQECVMDLMHITKEQAAFLLEWAGKDPVEKVSASSHLPKHMPMRVTGGAS